MGLGSFSNADAVPATTLGTVKRLVCRAQQLGARTGMNRERGDTDRRGDAAVIRNVELLDACAQAFSHNQGAIRISLGQNQNKFITTKPRRRVDISQFLSKDAGQHSQGLVARIVTCGVVKMFEAIEIKHQQRYRLMQTL